MNASDPPDCLLLTFEREFKLQKELTCIYHCVLIMMIAEGLF